MDFMLCAALLAADATSDWYIVGGAYLEEVEVEGLSIGDETGLRIGFGKSLNEELDLEFEFGTNEFSYTDAFTDATFDYTHFSAMIGYNIPMNDTFTIVPKAGLGLTDLDVNVDDVDFGILTGSQTELTWKLGVHAEYRINESLIANIGYRFETTAVDIAGFGELDLDSSGLMFGVQFSF